MPTLTVELLYPEAKTILDSLENVGFITIGQLPKPLNFSEQQGFGTENFWHQKSVDELAQEQNVSPINDLDRLFGCGKDLWETEKEWSDYLESIQSGRKERT